MDLKQRIEAGYVLSIYGNKDALVDTMRNDINELYKSYNELSDFLSSNYNSGGISDELRMLEVETSYKITSICSKYDVNFVNADIVGNSNYSSVKFQIETNK